MCGRYSLTTPIEGLRRLFGFDQIPNLPAQYNIAPTQAVLAVRADHDAATRSCFMARWGLIPSWSKDPSVGTKMINARSETVQEKPSFRTAFKRRRCLIPADAFYEWKTIGGAKQPFRISFEDQEVFAFAGLWERWQGGDGSDVETCSILTTEAIPAIADIHHRMPVILDPDAFSPWLNGQDAEAADLMQPYQGTRTLASWPVSKRVNSVANDDETLMDRVEVSDSPDSPKKVKKDQLSLF